MSFHFQNNPNNDFVKLCEIVQSFGVDVPPFTPSERVVDRGLRARVNRIVEAHTAFRTRSKIRP